MLTAALFVVLQFGAPAASFAIDCDGVQSAGYRVLALDDGRKVAVWYPAAAPEQPFAYSRTNYGFMGRVAADAPPLAVCPHAPLVLFSHDYGGCALQSIFITEELARHGYVVAAPDHRDAGCPIGSAELKPLRTDKWFLPPEEWNDQSDVERLHDLRDTMHLIANDPAFVPVVDAANVGAMGHSLGGYSVLGMAGAWPLWKTPEVKAVVALSAYLEPLVARGLLSKMGVPVMYQVAHFDRDVARLQAETQAFAVTRPPKYYVELKDAAHFDLEWTNLQCLGQPNVAACLKRKPNAALIDGYVIAFFDRYLKGKAGTRLDSNGAELERYLRVP
jgi:dienelactone hydrolase